MNKFRIIFIVLLTISAIVGCKKDEVRVMSVSLDKTSLELVEGQSEKLTPAIAPKDADNQVVSWSSSDNAIASVDDKGMVLAVKEGKATIKVTTADGGKTASCTVTVKSKSVSVTGVTLDKSELEITEGESMTLVATVTPEDASVKSVSWKSSDETVTTVDEAGKVTALKEGTSTITVTTVDGGKTAACAVTVNAKIYPVESVSLDATELTLEQGETRTLVPTVLPENASNKAVTWTTSDEAIATVDETGKVTAVAVDGGTATINVTTVDGEKTATCAVTVKPVPHMELDNHHSISKLVWMEIDAKPEDRAGVWIDRNNNGKKDDGEEVTQFSHGFVDGLTPAIRGDMRKYLTGTVSLNKLPDLKAFTLENGFSISGLGRTVKIYGKVTHFNAYLFDPKTMDFSNNPYLTHLDASCCFGDKGRYTTVRDLGINTCPEGLEFLRMLYSDDYVVDMSRFKNLKYFERDASQPWNYHNSNLIGVGAAIKTLDLSSNNKLETLIINYCGNLKTLKIENYTALKHLDLGNNQLLCSGGLFDLNTVLGKNPALEYLSCGGTGTASIDLSTNIALKTLICSGNGDNFTTLDVSKNTALEKLICGNNSISVLDISKNKKLNYLDCIYCKINNLDASNMAIDSSGQYILRCGYQNDWIYISLILREAQRAFWESTLGVSGNSYSNIRMSSVTFIPNP